jgi:hypothetical protein
VMELAPGQTLHAPLKQTEALRIAVQIAEALAPPRAPAWALPRLPPAPPPDAPEPLPRWLSKKGLWAWRIGGEKPPFLPLTLAGSAAVSRSGVVRQQPTYHSQLARHSPNPRILNWFVSLLDVPAQASLADLSGAYGSGGMVAGPPSYSLPARA